MLVSAATKKLVLKLRNPARVTTVIPTARVFTYQGQEMVAVPHGLDEVRVLRNMGFSEAPSPIRYHYTYPGRFKPFYAQRATSEFLTLNPKAFVLNDMGTGKTLAALWAWDYLRSQGLANKLLVVSPLSTLERTWADEVFQHFPHLTVGVLHGTKERRLKILKGDYDIYVINHDGIGVIEKALIEKAEINGVLVDEVASFRNASTNRWKSLNRVCAGRDWVWGMTGTPTPNSPVDAWAQCRLIVPGSVPRYMGAFRDSVMLQAGQFKWVPRAAATDVVARAMQPSIRFSREQCVDLPPAIFMPRQVAMTSEQTQAYKEMVGKLKMDYQNQQVTAVNEGVKRLKLIQIACGVVYGADGSEVVLPTAPRLDVVREVIEEASGKIIVFVPFKAVLRYVAAELAKDYTVAIISGDVPAAQRATIFQEFQQNHDPRVLVAVPSAMSHGLTLTEANTIIWYAPVDNHETYQQANARVTRPGQRRTQYIVNIQSSVVERRIYERLKAKEKLQGSLLDDLQEAD